MLIYLLLDPWEQNSLKFESTLISFLSRKSSKKVSAKYPPFCSGFNVLTFNSLAPGRFEWYFRYVIFKQILVTGDWGISCPDMNVIGLHWWPVNIGSGNGLVPSGNKPLPEPMLTQICHHMASLGQNELKCQCHMPRESIYWSHPKVNIKARSSLSARMPSLRPSDAHMPWNELSLVQIMTCCLFGTKSLPVAMLTYHLLRP